GRRQEKLADLSRRLFEAGTRRIEVQKERLDALERMRQTLGYEATLQRGYAVVRGDGALVKSVAAAKKAATIEIEFADGRFEPGGAPAPKPKPKKKSDPEDMPDQGNLF
ncbi:MAG: exodeoxyribonuclease VII large subunit, partial [Marinomonas sp.]